MKREELTNHLKKHLPENAIDYCADLIVSHRIHLTITKHRTSKFGDYRPPLNFSNHRISINYNLNQYSFLTTFIHEVAHLTNWEKFKNKVDPHGYEWKREFQLHLHPFLQRELLPEDIHLALMNYLRNPAASTCTDKSLFLALKKYDANGNHLLLEHIPHGSVFRIKGSDKVFLKGDLMRKNFLCTEAFTNRKYRISPIAEVEIWKPANTNI